MMQNTAQPQNSATVGAAPVTNSVQQRRKRIRRIIGFTIWGIGLILILVSCYIVHGHPGPYPFEVTFSRAVQSLNIPPWLLTTLVFSASLIDPVNSAIALILWLAFMVTFGWYRQAAFLILTVSIGNAIDALLGDYVVRPRPSTAYLIRVEGTYHANSFPSGHCAHTMLYYGALLYLSFSEPVRKWRYRWVLIPLQIYAAFNILTIGFERIYQGEHWFYDTAAGTLDGLLWLTAGIFLYNWIPELLQNWQAKRQQQQAQAASARTA